MKISYLIVIGLTSLTSFGLTACSNDEIQTIQSLTVYINDKAGPEQIIVTESPMNIRGTTRFTTNQPVSVEFFDGKKSIGVTSKGVKRPDASATDFTLSISVTNADNGDHSYMAVFTYDSSTNLGKVTSEPTKATIKL